MRLEKSKGEIEAALAAKDAAFAALEARVEGFEEERNAARQKFDADLPAAAEATIAELDVAKNAAIAEKNAQIETRVAELADLKGKLKKAAWRRARLSRRRRRPARRLSRSYVVMLRHSARR